MPKRSSKDPNRIAFDPGSSTIFFSSGSLNCVRAFSIGGNIATVAGTGRAEDSGLGGPALRASFALPYGLAFDSGSGALYIAARGTRRTVRALSATGLFAAQVDAHTAHWGWTGCPERSPRLVRSGLRQGLLGIVCVPLRITEDRR